MKWGASNFNVQITFLEGGGTRQQSSRFSEIFSPLFSYQLSSSSSSRGVSRNPLLFIYFVSIIFLFFLDRFSKTSFIVVHLS